MIHVDLQGGQHVVTTTTFESFKRLKELTLIVEKELDRLRSVLNSRKEGNECGPVKLSQLKGNRFF